MASPAHPVLLSSETLKLRPRRSYRPWATRLLLFAAVVSAVEGLVGERGLAETLRARRELQRGSAALHALRAQNQHLQDEVLRLSHDLRAIEDLARRDLGLVKSGEVLVILRDVRN